MAGVSESGGWSVVISAPRAGELNQFGMCAAFCTCSVMHTPRSKRRCSTFEMHTFAFRWGLIWVVQKYQAEQSARVRPCPVLSERNSEANGGSQICHRSGYPVSLARQYLAPPLDSSLLEGLAPRTCKCAIGLQSSKQLAYATDDPLVPTIA